MLSEKAEKQNLEHEQIIEKGDLFLSSVISHALILFGITRIGKTSLGHYLNNNVLEGREKDGKIFYEVASQFNKNGKIGQQFNSQTQIPNRFQSSSNKTTIIDFPGTNDSYGCHRIISNSYFYYRVFSKVQNMKFALVFDEANLYQGVGKEIVDTVRKFYKTFKNFDAVKKDVIASTVFILTKVNHKDDALENAKKRFNKLIQPDYHLELTEKQKEFFREIIGSIANSKKNRIFLFKKAQVNKQTTSNTMLLEIDSVTVPWTRDFDQKNKSIVSVSEINFTAGDLIRQEYLHFGEGVFKQKFDSLIQFKKRKINRLLTSGLTKVLMEIVEDARGPPLSCKFLEEIKKVVDKEYNFLEEENFIKEERMKLEQVLFENEPYDLSKSLVIKKQKSSIYGKKQNKTAVKIEEQSQGVNQTQKENYWLKKIQVIEDIAKKSFLTSQNFDVNRSVESLAKHQNVYIELFKIINKIRLKKQNGHLMIFKFGYLIYRLIEECKIFTLIFASNNPQAGELPDFDIFRPLQDVLPTVGQQIRQINQFKRQYALNFTKHFDEYNINEETVNFFQEIQPKDQHRIQLLRNSSKVLIAFSNDFLKKNIEANEITQESKKIVSRIYISIKKIQQVIIQKNIAKSSSQHNQLTEIMFSLSMILAQSLKSMGQFKLAKNIFSSIQNIPAVLEIFQKEISFVKDKKEQIKLLLELAQFASKRCLKDTAMKAYQGAFSKSVETETKKIIAEMILEEATSQTHEKCADYLKAMSQFNFYTPLKADIQNQIVITCGIDQVQLKSTQSSTSPQMSEHQITPQKAREEKGEKVEREGREEKVEKVEKEEREEKVEREEREEREEQQIQEVAS